MYWQLGDIVFEKLNSFSEFGVKTENEIAEHSLIKGKPRLQSTGQKANEVNLLIHIHSMFADPKKQYEKLEGYRNDLSVLSLIGGDGKVYGEFVIKSIDLKISQLTPDGKWVEATLDLSLLENYWSDAQKKAEQEAKDGAFATIDKVPSIQSGDIPLQGQGPLIVGDLQKVNNQAKSTESLIDKAKRYEKDANGWMDSASSKLTQYQAILNGLQTKLTAATNLGTSATNLLNLIAGLQASGGNLANSLGAHDLLTSSGLSKDFMSLNGAFFNAGAPIGNMVTMRQ